MNMTFGKLIGGIAILIAAVVFSLKEATADTVQDNCVGVGNVAMKVAEFRDIHIPIEITVGKLVEAGLPNEMAVRLSVWVYSTPQADRVTIGRWFYSFCMKEAGEAL